MIIVLGYLVCGALNVVALKFSGEFAGCDEADARGMAFIAFLYWPVVGPIVLGGACFGRLGRWLIR